MAKGGLGTVLFSKPLFRSWYKIKGDRGRYELIGTFQLRPLTIGNGS